MIIVPSSVSVTKETLNELKKFVERGKKLLIIGDASLTVNEYGDKHDAKTVQYIKKSIRSGTFPAHCRCSADQVPLLQYCRGIFYIFYSGKTGICHNFPLLRILPESLTESSARSPAIFTRC